VQKNNPNKYIVKSLTAVLSVGFIVLLVLFAIDSVFVEEFRSVYNCNIPLGFKTHVFVIVAVLALVAFMGIQFTHNISSRIVLISNALVVGGGAHNLVSRVKNVCVADYLHIFDVSFNFADVCVSIGLASIFCYNFLEYVFRSKKDNFDN